MTDVLAKKHSVALQDSKRAKKMTDIHEPTRAREIAEKNCIRRGNGRLQAGIHEVGLKNRM